MNYIINFFKKDEERLGKMEAGLYSSNHVTIDITKTSCK